MSKLFRFVAIVFTVSLLFSCKGKQVASNDDSLAVESGETNDDMIADEADLFDSYAEVKLTVTEPQPIDFDFFNTSPAAEYSNYSSVQQRLINDLLKLDNSSAKALVDSKDVLKKYFKNVSAKQCDSLYITYFAYANLHRYYVTEDEYYSQVFENYFHSYDDFEELPLVYQPIVKELNGYGIQLIDLGEGCADLAFYSDYFYELFKPYTTEATREYLRLMAFEQEHELLFDAAVCITWEELADRIVNFEEYLDKFPNSIFTEEVQSTHNSYTILLLLGCDNTPTFDWHDGDAGKLNSDVYESYQNIIESYSHRKLADILKEYCSLLKKNDMAYDEDVEEFIGQFVKNASTI